MPVWKRLKECKKHLSRGSIHKYQNQLNLWKGYNFPLLSSPYILHGNSITFHCTVYHGQKHLTSFSSIYQVFFSEKFPFRSSYIRTSQYKLQPNDSGHKRAASSPLFLLEKLHLLMQIANTCLELHNINMILYWI